MRRISLLCVLATNLVVLSFPFARDTRASTDDWPQAQGDARRSGHAPSATLPNKLGLLGTIRATDSILASPVVADGRVFVIDASGVVIAANVDELEEIWRVDTTPLIAPIAKRRTSVDPSGGHNVGNIAAPAVAGEHLHVGTVGGVHFVLRAATGEVVRAIDCGEPIFSSPVVTERGVYVATLGSRLLALDPDGAERFRWDFVRERLGFDGDRWDGAAWAARGKRATWRDQFLCSRDLAVAPDGTIVLPAGGAVVWLADKGDRADFLAEYRGSRESPATLGLSIASDGRVYRQWHRRDNNGDVEILSRSAEGHRVGAVPGTETSYKGDGLISFAPVAIRGDDVFRSRPEHGRGVVLHPATGDARVLVEEGTLAPPAVTEDALVTGGLDGVLRVVPIDPSASEREPFQFRTPFGRAFSAPVAIASERIFAVSEDGHLYVFGASGKAEPPSEALDLTRIRSPYKGPLPDDEDAWFTNFGDFANTNSKEQGIEPPFEMRWIRRFEGTVKHMSVCGGGRVYTHTAEGQIFAVEQESGRLLWRRYFPGVHVSFTAPLYWRGRLYVPQAGLEGGFVRCLEATTGELVWEAPFTGSPSWNRQLPPIAHENVVIYLYSTGRYRPEGWLFEHQNTFGFPKDQRPIVQALDIETGRPVWTLDFSRYGNGGDDAGMCLLDGTLYWSCYFGDRDPPGVTAAINPKNGDILWTSTSHAVHAGCTVSGKDGKLYLGGYNPVQGKENRVWCLDAKSGELVWQSDPLTRAIHVVTIGSRFLFTHSQYKNAYLLGPSDGGLLKELLHGYNCTRFTLSGPYILGANMDVWDTTDGIELVSTGPAVDVLQCVGAFVSNGRLFYTANGGGIQLSMVCGEEAKR